MRFCKYNNHIYREGSIILKDGKYHMIIYHNGKWFIIPIKYDKEVK